MPYKSDAQRKFFHTDTAKDAGITGAEVKEFDQASKGKELPEHVKKMADGGDVDVSQLPTGQGDEFTEGIKAGVNHDSDAVKSYLSSKFAQMLHPNMGEHKPQETMPEPNPTTASAQGMCDGGPAGMADGGYPHVIFMEDETPAEVKKTVHMAKGGVTPKEDMTHEKKLSSVYKAMGIKGYADAGLVTPATTPDGP